MTGDLLSLIETAYRFDSTPRLWLEEVAAATHAQVGAGRGLLAFYYDVDAATQVRVGDALQVAMPIDMASGVGQVMGQMPPDFVRRTFVRCEATTQSTTDDARAREMAQSMMAPLTEAFGWRDIFMVGGMDPSQHGLYLGAWLAEETRLSSRRRALWTRIAVHLVTAYRLRRRLAQVEERSPDSADAILTPSGRVEHAQGDAEAREARDTLGDAVRTVETARGRLRREDPDRAVDMWKGLVSGRWTLVDHFEKGGQRFVLARRNDVAIGGLSSLTERERQALGYASLGQSNKVIAYEMGISPSTVGVLLHRAARKLEARTRDELIARYQVLVGDQQ